MIKVELIELLQARFPKVDPGIIELNAGRAFNQIIYEVFRNDLSNLDLYAKEYKNVAVLQDPDTDEYYSVLPEQICQLPDHAEGVRRIRKMKSKSLDFVPVQKDSVATFDGMIPVYDPTIGYSVEGARTIYDRNPEVTVVRMDLVIPFEKYDMGDNIYVPAGQDENLLMAVAQFIEGSPPENTVP